MGNDGFMIPWKSTHCFEGLDVVIHTVSQQKGTIGETGKEQGMQLLMQNNAVYTLFTLLWLAISLIKSLSSSRSCLLYEVTIYFPLEALLLLTEDVPRLWGEYPKVGRGGESRARLAGLSGVGAEQWDRGTPGWPSMLPLPCHTAATSKPLHGLRWVMPCQSLGLPQRERGGLSTGL